MIREPVERNPLGVFMSRTLNELCNNHGLDEPAIVALDRKIEANSNVLRRMVKVMPARAVAANIALAVDAALVEQDKKDPQAANVKCRGRGCSHCCHIQVTCTEPEAELLVAAAHARRLKPDVERLRAQTAAGDDFASLPVETRRCVFLDDSGACRVYDVRPNRCRSYRVITDPTYCDTVANNGARVGILASADAEIIASAAMRAFRNGPMSELLLEKLPS